MVRIPLPFPDSALVLTPRFGELPAVAQAGLLAGLCLLPLALIVWLYRSELRLVTPAVALALLGLRLAVLVLFLFVLCLQPVVSHAVRETIPGRVLVAVDRSGSTDIADPQRPAVEKLRLARALRIAADLCLDAQLDDWIGQYEQKGTIQAERKPIHDQVCRRVDAWTRGQVAQRLLAPDGGGLLPALTARHRVELLGFAGEAWDATDLEELFPPKPATDPGRSQAAAAFTDLHLPLARALERNGRDEGRILGVVILTDGRHNRGPLPGPKATELGEHRLPVYPIALGARKPPPDIAVAAVRAPATAFKAVDVPVDATVRIRGLPAGKLTVELKDPSGKVLDTCDLDHDGADRSYLIHMQTRLDQTGAQALAVTVRPKAGPLSAAMETTDENNRRTVLVTVADDKAKVLLIDGEARWEFHYLSTALARDRTVDVRSVVFDQPRLGTASEEVLEKAGHPARALPAGTDALASYHCIILGDVSPDHLPVPERLRLEKYVAEAGGTLVLVAGKRFLPLAFTGPEAPGGEDGDPLARLLPVEEPRAVDLPRGFSITPTHAGRQAPFMQLEPTPEQSERRWAELPRHYWAVAGRAKPGATPLASLADEPPGGDGKPADAEREHAYVVRQNYGFGRVLFVGLDSTWRWRFRVGDAYHHRFWGQVVRWAAADRPLLAGNEFVRFGTGAAVYRQGQEIDLTARVAEEAGPLKPDLLAGARVLRQGEDGRPEETAALVPLTRREGQPRVLQGRLTDLPPGRYAVELVIPDLSDRLLGPADATGQRAPLRSPFTVAPPDSEEMTDLATDGALLEEIAARSGGRVFTPENAGELVKLLTERTVTRERVTRHALAEWWLTLLAFLALVTAEWVGRKWAGLP